MWKELSIKVLILLGLSGQSISATAQDDVDTTFSIADASMYYPHQFKPKVVVELAMSQIILPFDWLETAVQAPLFQFHANFGLPGGFALDGRFSSILVSNQISLGPRWNYQHPGGNLALGVGHDIAYTFGYLSQFGFASSAHSWINYPNLSIGWRRKDTAFTIKGEAVIVTAVTTKQGENEIASDKNFWNGWTVGLYIEQPLHFSTNKNKATMLVIGVKDSYMKYHYMAWPAFSTFNRFYHMPEFYLGFIL